MCSGLASGLMVVGFGLGVQRPVVEPFVEIESRIEVNVGNNTRRREAGSIEDFT